MLEKEYVLITKIIILGITYLILTIVMRFISINKDSKSAKLIYKLLFSGLIIGVLSVSTLSFLIFTELKSTVDLSQSYDYIVILGAGLEGDQVSERLRIRLDTAIDIINRSDAIIIVSGGQGPHEKISEAEAMSRYIIERGVSDSRILKEEESTSTQENILFSNRLMEQEHKRVTIVTSDYHMCRAKMLGERIGWEVYGQSGVNVTKELLRRMIREVLALAKDIVVRTF